MKKELSEPARLNAAFLAASYMRWYEVRRGHSPSSDQIQEYIRGTLDSYLFSYEPDEPAMIEILALSLAIDGVEAFMREHSLLEKLDETA